MMKFLIPILAMCLYISINGQTIRQIKPSDTDSQINLFDADSHYVYISPNFLLDFALLNDYSKRKTSPPTVFT